MQRPLRPYYKDSSSNAHCLASVVLCHSCPRASLCGPFIPTSFHVWNTTGTAQPSSISSACTTVALDHSRLCVLTLRKQVPRAFEFSLVQVISNWTEYSRIICKKKNENLPTESLFPSKPRQTGWASTICTYLSILILQTSPMMQQQTLQHLGAFPAHSSKFVYILLTYQSQRHNKKHTVKFIK